MGNDKKNDEIKAKHKRGLDSTKRNLEKIEHRLEQLGSFATIDAKEAIKKYGERFKKLTREVNIGGISETTYPALKTASASANLILTRLENAKRGSAKKYDQGLQALIDELFVAFAETGKLLTDKTFREWVGADPDHANPKETGIPDCDDVYLSNGYFHWTRANGSGDKLKLRSLHPYFKRAKEK